MKYLSLNLSKFFPLLAIGTLVFTACDKVKTTEPLNGAGQTLIKLINGGTTATPGHVSYAIDFLPVPTTLTVADVRRDVANAGELTKSINVVVKDDTAVLRAKYPGLTPLPAAWYTLNYPKVGGSGGTMNITITPGAFAAPLKITIPDATVLNPSTLYGLAFTIQSVSEGTLLSERTVVIEIGAKNAYDGIYSYVSGFVQRYSAPGVPTTGDAFNGPLGPANPDVTMTTVGAYTVEVTGVSWADGVTGVGGIQGLKLTVDPVTNLVTTSSSGYGVNSNATLGNWAGKENRYDPVTKTFYLNMRWNPLTTTREYSVVWRYKGPR